MGFFDTVKDVGSSIADSAMDIGSGIKHAVTHPKESWQSVKNFGSYVADNPGRAAHLAAQGLVGATTSIVGMVGDLGVLAYSKGIRHGINYVAGTDLQGVQFGVVTDYLTDEAYGTLDKVGFERFAAENDYERTILYGTQAVGEIAAFVAVTVATAGVGGVAWASVRGGSAVARSAAWAGKTARIMSPLATKGVFALEAGGAALAFNHLTSEDRAQAARADKTMIAQLEASGNPKGKVLDTEIAEELTKRGIDPDNVTIDALTKAGVITEGMTEAEMLAIGIDPATGGFLSSDRTPASDYARSDDASDLGEQFAQMGMGKHTMAFVESLTGNFNGHAGSTTALTTAGPVWGGPTITSTA